MKQQAAGPRRRTPWRSFGDNACSFPTEAPMKPTLSADRSNWLLPVLGMMVAFAPLSIDMYLPALPALARDFQAPAEQVQATLALYFIGMALKVARQRR